MVHATVPMLEHAVWCQGIGDKSVNPNGSKMFPEQMATSMRLHGTAAGHALFPSEAHMAVSATGQPTFKLCEQLTAQQLKTYAAKTRAALLSQLENLKAKVLKKAEVQAAEAADPQGTRLKKLLKTDLKAECEGLGLDCSGLKEVLLERLIAHYRNNEQED